MKRLIIAIALTTLAAGVFAAEEAAKPEKDAKQTEAVAGRPQRGGFDRAKFEEHMKKRRAERRSKVVEILKANGIADEAKVNEVADAIEKVYSRPQRPPRPMGMRPRPGRPAKGEQAAPAPAPAPEPAK